MNQQFPEEPAPRDRRGGKGDPYVKVYLVLVPVAFERNGRPNRKIVAAKLTRKTADELATQIPNAYVEKVYADKKTLPAEQQFRRL